jgi:hypothetical protein
VDTEGKGDQGDAGVVPIIGCTLNSFLLIVNIISHAHDKRASKFDECITDHHFMI